MEPRRTVLSEFLGCDVWPLTERTGCFIDRRVDSHVATLGGIGMFWVLVGDEIDQPPPSPNELIVIVDREGVKYSIYGKRDWRLPKKHR